MLCIKWRFPIYSCGQRGCAVNTNTVYTLYPLYIYTLLLYTYMYSSVYTTLSLPYIHPLTYHVHPLLYPLTCIYILSLIYIHIYTYIHTYIHFRSQQALTLFPPDITLHLRAVDINCRLPLENGLRATLVKYYKYILYVLYTYATCNKHICNIYYIRM